MSIFDELFDGLAIALDVTPVRTIGHEFEPELASDAWNLLHNTAVDCGALPFANESGMFPRIKVQEIEDLHLIMQAMNAYGEQARLDLMANVSGYAMGGTEFTWEQLREQAAEYARGMRLGRALRKAEIDMKHQMMAADEAAMRADNAYREMDVVSYPTRFVERTHEQIVKCARSDALVMQHVINRAPISAIQELRAILPGLSLRASKMAIDEILNTPAGPECSE